MEYLVRLGLRDGAQVPPSFSTVYDFRDGTLQGWTNQPSAAGGSASFVADAGVYDNRTPAVTGVYKILFSPFLTGRDGYHQTIVLRSPAFGLRGLSEHQALAFSLLGGKGVAAAAPATNADLPANASPSGFLGVALRRTSDGRYLLSSRRTSDAQNQNWQRTVWNASQLAVATGTDAVGETYTLDLIDSFGAAQAGGSQGWGWIALDAVSIPWTGTQDPKIPAVLEFNQPGLTLTWSSYPGDSYQVFRSPDLNPDSWIPASGILPATPPTNQFTIPANSPRPGREFFRIERK
jgi:hypothetical protein